MQTEQGGANKGGAFPTKSAQPKLLATGGTTPHDAGIAGEDAGGRSLPCLAASLSTQMYCDTFPTVLPGSHCITRPALKILHIYARMIDY